MALNIEDSHPDLSDEDVQKIAHAFRDSGITPAGSALLLSHLAWLYEKMAEGNNPIDLISYGRDMHKKSVRDLIICVEIIARKGKGQSIYRAQKEIAEREGMSVTNVKTIWKRRPVLLRDTSLFDSAGKLGGNAGD